MPKATYHETTYSFTRNGNEKTVYLKYFLCNHREIRFRNIGGSSVRDSEYYGVNGTYLSGSTIFGVAIDQGQLLSSTSGANRYGHLDYPCGTMFFLDTVQNGIFLGSDKIVNYEGHSYNGTTLSVDNTLLAVGGTSMFIANNNMTQLEYYDAIQNEDPPFLFDTTNVINRGDTYRPRTAIIYLGGSLASLNTVLLTVHPDAGTRNTAVTDHTAYYTNNSNGGVSLWELRTLIKDVFAPMTTTGTLTHVINLDGGSSTQIAYKDTSGNKVSYQVMKNSNDNALVRTMLTVDM